MGTSQNLKTWKDMTTKNWGSAIAFLQQKHKLPQIGGEFSPEPSKGVQAHSGFYIKEAYCYFPPSSHPMVRIQFS